MGAAMERPSRARARAGDLCAQRFRRLAQERQRAVQEGRVLDAVVGEGLHAEPQSFAWVVRLGLRSLEAGVDLGQVAGDREDEQLLLGGEMAVDQGLVDPHPAGDAVDPGVLHAALVEEVAGGVDDLALARAPGRGARSDKGGREKCNPPCNRCLHSKT